MLEATYVHLYFSRGPLEQAAGNGEGVANGQADEGYGTANAGMGARQLPNISGNARRVFQTLKSSPQNNEGLHVQNIAANLGMPVAEVMKAGDELLNHSLIFTTVDDNTWALLEF